MSHLFSQRLPGVARPPLACPSCCLGGTPSRRAAFSCVAPHPTLLERISTRRYASTSGSAGADEPSQQHPEEASSSDTGRPPVVEASAIYESGDEARGRGAGAEEEQQEASSSDAGPQGEDSLTEEQRRFAILGAQYEEMLETLLPTVPLPVALVAAKGYVILAALHAAVGIAFIACGVTSPQTLLPEAALTGENCVLLGCVGAGALLGAALHTFLLGSVMVDESCTWRHQRLNFVLIAAAVTTTITQLIAVTHATPLMSLLILGLSVPTALLCAWHMLWCLSCGENFAWAIDWSRPVYTAKHLMALIGRDFSTLPGVLLLVLGTVSCWGFLRVLDTGLISPLTWQHVFESGLHTSMALRQAAGSGLLLLAAAAHTLLEYAPWMSMTSSLDLARATVERDLIDKDRLQAAMKPPPERFQGLNVTLFLAMAVQAFFLLQVHGLGADVNLDAALWAPLYAGTMLSLLYSACVALAAGWQNVVALAAWALGSAMALCAWLVDKFVYPWEWQTPAKR